MTATPSAPAPWSPGPRNLLTDVPGLLVGSDGTDHTGCTVVLGAAAFVAGVHVMGGAPGTRETDLLDPSALVDRVDALVLSGGSAHGLAAADGVTQVLRRRGRGFPAGGHRVPIVPAAILFDLGDWEWEDGTFSRLGAAAVEVAGADFGLGSTGAGTGATIAGLRGGLGSASLNVPGGWTVGALVTVNAVGAATVAGGPHFWAAPWERGAEFGGLGPAPPLPPEPPRTKLAPATTIAVVGTDAKLDKAQARRLAIAAHDGIARALVPAHTPFDGDLVFAAATGSGPAPDAQGALRLGHAAADCLARAIARAVFHAAPGGSVPSWSERFGHG